MMLLQDTHYREFKYHNYKVFIAANLIYTDQAGFL